MRLDTKIMSDLVAFARIEVASHDIEPWAEVIRAVELPTEQKTWLATLYNTHDDLHSAWKSMRLWPTPADWGRAGNRHKAAEFNCTQERRNLRGGRVLQRHASYCRTLAGRSELEWMAAACTTPYAGRNFAALTEQMREVWGVGRQSAFEWAEFAGKVMGLPVDAADGQLWDSSGPRRSLEDLWGLTNPTPSQLDEVAHLTRDYLYGEGVDLAWVDFETVICDFLVMRRGRYYPGRHLAALWDEIDLMPGDEDRSLLIDAWDAVIPAPWSEMPSGGIDPAKLDVYAKSGRIIDKP